MEDLQRAPDLEKLMAELSWLRRLAGAEGPRPVNLWLHEGDHWHLELLPRLSVFAAVELGAGHYVNTLAPETAAETLRRS